MRNLVFTCLLLLAGAFSVCSQELYVFSEPASNLPGGAASAMLGVQTPVSRYNSFFKLRYTPSVKLGLSKDWMLQLSSSLSDYYYDKVSAESVKLYAKYRFYTRDEIHRHFRMAAFAAAAYTNNPFLYGDLNLDGDNSGLQGGLIATQLLGKFAFSATGSWIHVFANNTEHSGHLLHSTDGINYHLAAGYLLLPRQYSNYQQLNLNLYFEVMGMKGVQRGDYMLDLAPALQLIVSSSLKINLGARFQATSNMLRVGEKVYSVGLEKTFLGLMRPRRPRLAANPS